MRIAVLTNDFPPTATGGAGVIAAEQVRLLSSEGHDVRVWHKPFLFRDKPSIVRLFAHLLDLAVRRDVLREAMEFKPDVLITHNLMGCGLGTSARIKAGGAMWIHVLHDVQLFEPSGRVVDAERITLWQRFWSSIRRRALRAPDLVISPTHWLLEQHKRRGFFCDPGTRVVLLPNPGPAVEPVVREAPHTPLRLLFVGRFSDEKGAPHLQRVMQMLEGRGIPATLSMAGPACVSKQQSTVCVGPLAREEILALMRESDVLLVPSQIAENQPTVILEAASLGLPVIASRIGGIPETLGEDGVAVPPNNVAAWADAIARLAEPEAFIQAVTVSRRLTERHSANRYRDALLGLIVKR
jgi:glycosyltransferase involved in cell wall biosynthesis